MFGGGTGGKEAGLDAAAAGVVGGAGEDDDWFELMGAGFAVTVGFDASVEGGGLVSFSASCEVAKLDSSVP